MSNVTVATVVNPPQPSEINVAPPPPLLWSESLQSPDDRLKALKISTKNLSCAKMIVFDKDGTLGDAVSSLKRWAIQMTDKLKGVISGNAHAQNIIAEFHQTIGWDSENESVLPSAPLAAGTWDEQVATLESLMSKYSLDGSCASKWHSQIELHGADQPLIPNIREMLQECAKRGLTVAVCTSDVRESTHQALTAWEVMDVVHHSICADEVTNPKPSAEPLERLCEQTSNNITPRECIVVGDTHSDTGMARNANALLCIGVLTGTGTPEILTETGADVIIPSVADIPALLTAMGPA